MKKIIALLLLTYPFLCKANTDSLDFYTPDLVDSLLWQSYTTKAEVVNTTTQQAKRAGWLNDAWQFVTAPFRPVWGYYDEPDFRQHGPYTVFQHHKGNISAQVVAIRQKILAKDPAYFTLYAEIYKTAVSGQTTNCTGEMNPEETCLNGNTAKCKAFVG